MEARRPRGCLWPRRARAASWPNLFETIKIFSFWPEASVFTKASPFRFLFDPLLILFVRQMVNIFLPSSRKNLESTNFADVVGAQGNRFEKIGLRSLRYCISLGNILIVFSHLCAAFVKSIYQPRTRVRPPPDKPA